ncbi:Signal transduction histidine kinase [Eubacterium ruminantium]|nr:Signal transduction histidine kinase [Eubacterium ruminantium]
MKKRFFIVILIMLILTGAGISLYIQKEASSIKVPVHTTEINRHLLRLQEDWKEVEQHNNEKIVKDKSYDYVIIDKSGRVIMYTKSKMAKSIASATSDFDIIRNIEVNGSFAGSLIVENNMMEQYEQKNNRIVLIIVLLIVILAVIFASYYFYLYRRMVKPFRKLNEFAVRVSGGDLDTPLEMDREHIFGEFTEAFDIMREELKNSREREEAAVRSRKELVAELSHDIKTPVASIKAMADVMSLTAKDDMERETIAAINGKADQIDKLISNLFHATLEELEQLEVNADDVDSTDITRMLVDADYLKKIKEMDIQDAVVKGDKMRLNQVISNIIYNSYKYADTDIRVTSRFEEGEPANGKKDEFKNDYLIIEIADKGGGVSKDEIELIMEKFRRGSNSKGKDGSGLGLYISKYFMERMGGGISCRNGDGGFIVTLRIKVA